MKIQSFPMTLLGLEKIKNELKQLKQITRDQAYERVKRARSFCDFQVDFEYEKAVNTLISIDERIAELEYMIQHAEIIEKSESTQVEFGSTITFQEIPQDKLETYRIVGDEEADPLEGKISINSPMARSLLGAQVQQKVTVQTPGGEIRVKILSLS